VAAVERGVRIGCEAMQIFSRSPRAWKGKPLDPQEVTAFRRAREEAGLAPLAIHLPYLPNLATHIPELLEKSIRVLSEEMIRADQLGADFLVAHPGHVAPGKSREKAVIRVGQSVAQALAELDENVKVTFLLENTSGQKGELGDSLPELARIHEAIKAEAERELHIGICLDTAHAWGAGYNLARPRGQEEMLAEFDRVLGLDRLALIHLNDSLVPLGSLRDRHGPIGLGQIGARGLARLVRHPALNHLAGLMETPRESEANDLINMKRVKRWRGYGKL